MLENLNPYMSSGKFNTTNAEQSQTTQRQSDLDDQPILGDEIRYKNIPKLRLILSVVSLSIFYFGYCLAYLSNVSQQTMKEVFGPLSQKCFIEGLLIGILTVGAAIGSVISPFLMNKLTRKNLILVTHFAAVIICCILQYPNIYCLLFCRCIQGFLIGIFTSIVPIYINEVCPKQLVSTYGSYTQLFLTSGIVFAFTLGITLSKLGVQGAIIWRVMFGVPLLISSVVISAICLGFIPESPNSLLEHGKEKEAEQVISMFHQQKYVEDVLQEKSIIVEGDSNIDSLRTSNSYSESTKSLTYSKKAYFLGFQLRFMQQFTGISAIVTQIGPIVTAHNKQYGQFTPLIINTIQLAAITVAIFQINRFGRRTIILFGNAGLGICNFLIGAFLFLINDWDAAFWLILVTLIVYMIIYGLSLGPTVWFYVPEILPAKMVPLTTTMNWVACSITIIVLPIMEELTGDYSIFWLFGAVTMLSYFVNMAIMVETKDRTAEQICQEFQKSHDSN